MNHDIGAARAISHSGLPPAWRQALPALAALMLAILLVYRETVTVMVGVWANSETFTHAFLVPPMSLWLIWRLRQALAGLMPRPSPWVLLPMAAVAVVWLLGDLVVVNAVTHFALVALIVLSVPLVLGWPVTRAILFPLGFLFFAVPFGDFLLPLLMEWTADFTVMALSLSGIPVYREGLQFVIPSGNWSVVEACSGVRYLIASLMVGTLFAYLNYRALWRRWVFVGVAIVVPIVANWLRAYMIVMLGHLSNNKIAVGVDHLIYGWVFFGVVIMAMFMIGSRWAEPEDEPDAAASGQPAASAASSPAAAFWPMALAGLLVAAAAHAGTWALEQGERSAAAPALSLPGATGGWVPVAAQAMPLDWAPNFQHPRASEHRSYSDGQETVTAYVAYFRGQDYRSKLVNSMHSIVKADDSTWNRQNLPELPVAWPGGAVTLRLGLLQTAPSLSNSRAVKVVVGQTYWVDGRFTASAFEAKGLGALTRLRGKGDDGALVMLVATGTDERQLRALIGRFGTEALPRLSAELNKVQAAR